MIESLIFNSTYRRNICIAIPKFGVNYGIKFQILRRILEFDKNIVPKKRFYFPMTKKQKFLTIKSSLMRILKDLELVEMLGFGIRGITKFYNRNIFEFTDNTIYVQFPFEIEVVASETESKGIIRKKSKEESREEILKLIANNPKINTYAIAYFIGYSVSGVEKMIKLLKEEGVIVRRGSTKNGEWMIDESRGKVREKSKGKILELITENPKISVHEIAEIIGLSIAGVEKNIRQLKYEGIISRTSETKSGEWIVNK